MRSTLSGPPLVTILARKSLSAVFFLHCSWLPRGDYQAPVMRLASLKRGLINADSLGENLVFRIRSGRSAADYDGIELLSHFITQSYLVLFSQHVGALEITAEG